MPDPSEPRPIYPTLYWGLGMLVFGPLALAFSLTVVQRTLGSTGAMILGPLLIIVAFTRTVKSANRAPKTTTFEPNWSLRLGLVVGAVTTTIAVLIGFAVPFIRG